MIFFDEKFQLYYNFENEKNIRKTLKGRDKNEHMEKDRPRLEVGQQVHFFSSHAGWQHDLCLRPGGT